MRLFGPSMQAAGDPLETMAMRFFGQRFMGEFKFDHTKNAWVRWTGSIWEVDRRQTAERCMFELVEGLRQREPNQRKAIGKVSFSTNTLRGAQSLDIMAVVFDDFDTDRYLIGTPEGYVDLRTGKKHDPDPNLLMWGQP